MPKPSPGSSPPPTPVGPANGARDYRTFYYSELRGRKICLAKISERVGKISDIAFKMTDAYPEAAGILVEHGWGKPVELIPWSKVARIDDDYVFVSPPEQPDPATVQCGKGFPCFVDQPGWILLESHLMGKTIFDMDGRRTEVVDEARKTFSTLHGGRIGLLGRGDENIISINARHLGPRNQLHGFSPAMFNQNAGGFRMAGAPRWSTMCTCWCRTIA